MFIEFCYNIASFLWFGFLAARHLILASQPVMKSVPLEGQVLTTEPPGKSPGESFLRLFNYKAKIVLQKAWTSLHTLVLCGTVFFFFALLGPKIKGWYMLCHHGQSRPQESYPASYITVLLPALFSSTVPAPHIYMTSCRTL